MERRLAAIFAADVAGYSRLMSQDEVGTMETLTSHREVLDTLITQHRGRIANTAGDSVLAEFPSVVDAVQCALEAQAALASRSNSLPVQRRLQFRIGVHVGDVMLSGGDLFGDGINIAARLQALAEPGGICVSAAAHEYVRKALPVSFRDLGLQHVKNISEPLHIYAVGPRVQETPIISGAKLDPAPRELPGSSEASAPEGGRLPHIGVLLAVSSEDTEYPILLRAFIQRLQQLGWSDGENVLIDVHWSAAAETVHKHAAELAAAAPDVILAPGSAAAGPMLQATQSIPVVFTVVPDPVGAGFVESLSRPGGNATGVISFEYGLGAKWLEVLKEVAPDVRRVGVLRDAHVTAGIGQWSAIQAAAPMLGVDVSPINLRDAAALERSVASFASLSGGGLMGTSSALSVHHRDLIVRLAAEHKLPAIYYSKAFVLAGGLVSYGPDRVDQFRRAAGYVDRVLNGQKPAVLPVLTPAKHELVVNLRTAWELGLTIPKALLARADEIVE
jgi:putative ABC transport system substrate-binding protein